MIIITLRENNAILESSEKVDTLSNGYYYLEKINTAYQPDMVFIYEVSEIPDDVPLDSRYCYTLEKGFYENPLWYDPVNQKVVTELLNQVTDLQMALCDVYEMLPAEEV